MPQLARRDDIARPEDDTSGDSFRHGVGSFAMFKGGTNPVRWSLVGQVVEPGSSGSSSPPRLRTMDVIVALAESIPEASALRALPIDSLSVGSSTSSGEAES